jgi:hypothetical protein
MEDNYLCHKCHERPANHTVGDIRLCCECYVKDGNAPADWHIACMKAYEKLKMMFR